MLRLIASSCSLRSPYHGIATLAQGQTRHLSVLSAAPRQLQQQEESSGRRSLHCAPAMSSAKAAAAPAVAGAARAVESYTPKFQREDSLPVLQAFMREYAFAQLICVSDSSVPLVSPLPFLIDTVEDAAGTISATSSSSSGGSGTPFLGRLHAHIARPNPLHALLTKAEQEQREVLVVFSGPHGYISPQFYLPQHENVPTWNYSAVHAYGIPCMETEADHELQAAARACDAAAAAPGSSVKPLPVHTPTQSILDRLVLENERKYMRDYVPHAGGPPTPWSTQQYPHTSTPSKRSMIVGFSIRLTRVLGKFKLSQNKDEEVIAQVIRGLKLTKQEELAEFMIKERERVAATSASKSKSKL